MHLSDAFMDTVAYVVYFLRDPSGQRFDYDVVRQKILGLITQSRAQASSFPQEDYDAACFAVCAWIDETIMNSSWEHRQLWMKEPLQLRFYQTTNAGELFFERLGGLGVHQREAREVYYLCLAMGFMGRFVREEDRFLLDQLKTSNLKVLTGSSLGTPQLSSQALFPEAYPTGEAPSRKGAGRGLPLILTAAVAAVPVVLFVVLAVVYSFVLGNVADALFTPRP